MHELAICESLMNQVTTIAQQYNSRRVTSVVVAVGALSGVEADLLKNAYTIASAGTVAADADLIIEALPVKVKCNTCGEESEVLPNKLVCKGCGDWRTTLISGDQLMLMNIELEKEKLTSSLGSNQSNPSVTKH